MDKICNIYNGGRLGNILYYLFDIFKLNKKQNNIKYIADIPKKYKTNDILITLNTLFNNNLNEYLIINLNENLKQLNRILDYKQSIYLDQNELNEFIQINFYHLTKKLHIFNVCNDNNTCILHIRNGDYIGNYADDYKNNYSKQFFNKLNVVFYNRYNYYKTIFKLLSNNNITTLIVISDNIEICKKLYNNLFKQYFKNIKYQSISVINDFIFLSFSQANSLILTNSTFSYWSGYISTYFKNKKQIFVPSTYNSLKDSYIRFIDNFTIINTNRNTQLI